MSTTPSQATFLTGNLFRHVTVMSMTASLGLMAVFVVDFVDMIFISMLGKSELAAAVGYAGAILFFTSSFGIGIAIAAGALVSRALGEGDEEMARRRAATTLIYGVIFGAIFAAIIWYYVPVFARWIGATGDVLDLTVTYLRIIVPSLPFLLVGMAGGAILRAHGAARHAMMATVMGGLVNAILDPILIFGFDLELTGAAFASVAARVAMAVYALIPIYKYHGGLRKPTKSEFGGDFGALVQIAFPAILTQLSTPIGQAYVTRSMAEYGEEAVAGMAVVSRLVPLAFAVVFALSGAIGPIIGQNYGAKMYDRVRQAFKDGLLFIALYTLFAAAVLFLLRGPIIALFNAEGLSAELILLFCGPIALLWFFNGVIFVTNSGFNNLGHPYYSTWVNWGRHTVGTIPFVIAGSALYGAKGILIGQALGGVVFALIALVLVRKIIRKTTQDGDISTAEPDPFAREARQLSLFRLHR